MPDPKDLYQRSKRATARYWRTYPAAKTEAGRAADTLRHEAFRVGWMIGWRAGKNAAKRQKRTAK